MANQFQEGIGQWQIDQSVILESFGQENAQKSENFDSLTADVTVLGQRGREQARGAVDIVPRGLFSVTNHATFFFKTN